MIEADVSYHCYILSSRILSILPGLAARTCQANTCRADFTAGHIAQTVFPTFRPFVRAGAAVLM
jgi:hypothetical protein